MTHRPQLSDRISAPLTLALTVGIVASTIASVQDIRPETIANQAIGWMRVYQYQPPSGPTTVDHRTYSVPQLLLTQKFATWIQATYVPVGGLGDAVRTVSEKLTLYNQNTTSLPQAYGAYAKVYIDLKYDAARKVVPASNSNVSWTLMANGVYGEPADALSTPNRYYFTLPSFAEQGYDPELERVAAVPAESFLAGFPSWFQRNSSTGNRRFVVMTKDKQLPFVTVTRGQYLAAVEAAVMRAYTNEKEKIVRDNAGSPRGIEVFTSILEAKHAKRIERLKANQERYKDRLEEPARIFKMQPDVLLENYADVFEGDGQPSLRLQVYSVDPTAAARSKGETPLWIVVSWTADMTLPAVKSMHEAVTKKFNAEYVYNYFFDPEKVKGVAYQPLPTSGS